MLKIAAVIDVPRENVENSILLFHLELFGRGDQFREIFETNPYHRLLLRRPDQKGYTTVEENIFLNIMSVL